MDKPTTVEQLMQWMPGAFLPAKAGNVKAVVQLNLTGESGGIWTVNVADGKCEVNQGETVKPNVTITASAADYLAIARGELNAVGAFMAGKVKVTGDMSLVMKFMDWFAR